MAASRLTASEEAFPEADGFEESIELMEGVLRMTDSGEATEEVSGEVSDFKKFLQRKGLTPAEIVKELQSRFDRWKKITLNIGIIGNSGSGKSTFVNTLRGLKPTDPGAAKSGVTQTTAEPTAYEHAKFPNVKFWDLLGGGTVDFPRETYKRKIRFDEYDFYVILSCTRFTENDLWYAKQIQLAGKKFYFLRTKINIDVRNDEDDYPETHNKEAVLKRIKDEMVARLNEANFNEPLVFLVCKYPKLYDFAAFEKQALNDQPELKKEVLLRITRTHTEETTKETTKKIVTRSWLIVLASTAIAALPVPFLSSGVDHVMVSCELEEYKKMYGLDEDSLKELGEAVGGNKAQQIIAEAMKKHCVVNAATGAVKLVLAGGSAAILMILKGGLKFLPFAGSAISAGISFTTTKLILSRAIAAMEEASLSIYTKVHSDIASTATSV